VDDTVRGWGQERDHHKHQHNRQVLQEEHAERGAPVPGQGTNRIVS
jgi:hypothetical protein